MRFLVVLIGLLGSLAHAREDLPADIDLSGASASDKATAKALPFAFASDTLGVAFGVAGVVNHAGQPQASLVGIGFTTNNNSNLGYLGAHNYTLADSQWLLSAESYRGRYTQANYYLPGNPNFPNERPGANESSHDNRVTTLGIEGFHRVYLDYVLPFGDGAQGAAASLLSQPNAAKGWNPLNNGVTRIKSRWFNEWQDLVGLGSDGPRQSSKGVKLTLQWDNRDSTQHSTRGGRTQLSVTKDWGSADRPSWSTWEFEQSLFVPLLKMLGTRSQVLALNYYLADTPSWNQMDSRTGMMRRPPPFIGINLGGMDRMRGFDSVRFHGRSATAYTAELRVTPEWQPLANLRLLRPYDIPWWQFVGFVETGRVADSFNLTELHKNMRVSYGFGARAAIEGLVVRADLAFSQEGSQAWFMINQSF
ncbi:hypothetical protein [Paraferrimonas sedimenticola]|uniref:Surface antigen n=1 Tax=Paraferrimonas sedimenticola TaxID=375674 RepID=A0AA37RVJ9_9GAMM|nr:hypothetical protein [Paraferrimonas sedimenticola]GLP95717.1 hypothetical protein GCM10007895_10230 [Paraferrimonas sedimenticola]